MFTESRSRSAPPARPRARVDGTTTTRSRGSDQAIYALLATLVGGAWLVSRQDWFSAGDRIGYWIGVAGGVAMLALFSYPLRKHVRVLHGLGKVKPWLVAHMMLGVAGPVLILLHCGFRFGAVNSAVALFSMLIVAASGVVGRFLYLHVHRGLSGEKTGLRALQADAGLDGPAVHSRLRFAPAADERLRAFEAAELAAVGSRPRVVDAVLLLPLRRWRAERDCIAAARAALRVLARAGGWTRAERHARERAARGLVRRYLRGVQRVAQLAAYERLFALWHVAHVPFVWLLVASAVVHVVAVHAY